MYKLDGFRHMQLSMTPTTIIKVSDTQLPLSFPMATMILKFNSCLRSIRKDSRNLLGVLFDW